MPCKHRGRIHSTQVVTAPLVKHYFLLWEKTKENFDVDPAADQPLNSAKLLKNRMFLKQSLYNVNYSPVLVIKN